MKTSELTGAALDWAVAKCEGVLMRWERSTHDEAPLEYSPSTDWAKAVQSLSVKAYLFYVSSRALKVGDCGPQLQAQVKQLG
jgi:hypothetical protein